MSAKLSHLIESIEPSATCAITEVANKLKSEGKKIIAVSIGEPDFPTPENVCQAANEAMLSGDTKYPSVEGTKKLKSAVVAKLKRENNLDYAENQVIVSNGAKHVLFNLFFTTINPGDEVIIPLPYWISYPSMVKIAGGKSIFLESDQNLKIDLNKLEHAINPKTKWLILNFPNNPSGVCITKEDLQDLAVVLRRFPHVNIVTDDIYEHIIYDGIKFYTLAEVAPDLYERVFVVNGVSKAYSMTGWRVGYLAGEKKVIDAISVLQSHSTGGVCSIAQAAAVEALNGPQNFLKDRKYAFEVRRNIIIDKFKDLHGIKCPIPQGAFYVFPNIKELFGRSTSKGKKIMNAMDFAQYLLEDYLIAVVPGVEFGMSDHFRMSYAISNSSLMEACNRVIDAVNNLK